MTYQAVGPALAPAPASIDTPPRPAPPPRTLLDVFQATVATHPRRIAIDAPDARLTYREFGRRVREFAGQLTSTGIGPGDRVGIRLPSGTAELYGAILGVLTAGAAYVPVDADDPPARADWIWAESDAAAVVTPGLGISLRHGPGRAARPATPADDAWVIFTSGSTGRPKGVAVGHRAAAAFVDAEARLISVSHTDRVLAGLSVAFDASCEEMWLAWRNGAALVPAPRALVRTGADLGPWLADRRISVVSTVPTLAALWSPGDLGGVRLLILGGEACPSELGWRLAAGGREVWNTYGPTEATVVSTAARIVPGEPVTIGEPLDGWQVAVVDPTGAPVPDGDVGELIITGAGLGRYLDPDLDNRAYAGAAGLGWARAYRSGDLVRRTGRGLDFAGRRDDQVKIGGRRIDLSEIQAELSAVPGVRAAAVVTRRTEAGNLVLAGYIVTAEGTSLAAVRARLADQLPQSLMPVLIPLTSLPVTGAGKLDRKALPWPPPASPGCTGGPGDAGEASRPGEAGAELTGTAQWLASLWQAQLGVRPPGPAADFFALGGSSLAAAKLTSELRERYASAAVSDIYSHRTLGALARHLDQLEAGTTAAPPPAAVGERRAGAGAGQIGGVAALIALTSPAWVVAVLAFNALTAGHGVPGLAWLGLAAAWLVTMSTPGRVLLAATARKLLLRGLRPGRYPRRSWLGTRVWFVDRLGELLHLQEYGGTPWARVIARLTGTRAGKDARLGTIPSAAALVRIGDGATLEAEADVSGWWIEGPDLVVGEVIIGAGARIGHRAVLMPGACVGAGAEVEPGAVVTGQVGAGERWAGSPARLVGQAGEGWPSGDAPVQRHRRLWSLAYAFSLTLTGFLPLIAFLPGLFLASAAGLGWPAGHAGAMATVAGIARWAPVAGTSFVITYAVLSALLARLLGRFLRPGWHSGGLTAWAAWTREEILSGTRTHLFPLYASIFTRPWLRLMGQAVGRRAEVSTAMGLSPLVTLGSAGFIADDVVFNTGRSRGGWLHLAPITVGDRVFLGNGALLSGATTLGDGALAGVQTTPPLGAPAGTSWFGVPALEFPRTADRVDERRTVSPPRRLVAARVVTDILRIAGLTSLLTMLGAGVFAGLERVGAAAGVWAMAAAAPILVAAAGLVAVLLTAMVKWLLMGRYRAGEHPLWSWFIWRDEIMNSAQEVLAGSWLLAFALGTPLMSAYLRLMGTRVGRDVWCDTLTITEFDMVTLGEGCAINRRACIETHLFHDRLMRIGPIRIGAGASAGPATAVLPDAVLGERCSVGGRSVVLRGERLAPGTRWHGAPVTAV